MASYRDRNSFFSVSANFILQDKNLPYDLYINSSSLENRERFVRIFPKNGILSAEDLAYFKRKYHQLYILEVQRDAYLDSIMKLSNASDVHKSEVIKNTAINYLSTIFEVDKEFDTELLNETVSGCRESVENMVDIVQGYNINEIQELIATLSFHDFYTYDHSINVAMYCISMYKTYRPQAKREMLVLIGLGGLLHDIGKIKIPTQIINKPDPLTEEEFALVKKHPDLGKELFEEHDIKSEGIDLDVIKRIIYEHHENYNGSGYPRGIKNEEIHLMARVAAIADFFDAITTKRSYHHALSTDEAISVMSRSVGRKLDPKLFEILARNVKKLVQSRGLDGLEIAEDFDPSQPHRVLPFVKPSAKPKDINIFGEKKKDFGKVKVETFKKKKVS